MDAVTANLLLAGLLVFANALFIWSIWPSLAYRYQLDLPFGALSIAWLVLLVGAATLYIAAPANVFGMGTWMIGAGSGPDASLPPVGVALYTLGSVLILVDANVHKLPNILVGTLAVETGIAAVVAAVFLSPAASFPWVLLASSAVWAAPLWVGYRFNQVGLGDVKLAAVLGFALGTTSFFVAVAALIFSVLTAGAHAFIQDLRGKGGRFALGPHMIAGAMVVWGAVVLGTVWL